MESDDIAVARTELEEAIRLYVDARMLDIGVINAWQEVRRLEDQLIEVVEEAAQVDLIHRELMKIIAFDDPLD
jgi:hypothetical protein